MPEPLEEWLRPHFDPSVGRPFLFYVAYGKTPDDVAISRSRYKFSGVPDGLEISAYGPTSSPETVDDFRTGYLWDRLRDEDEKLAGEIGVQDQCLIIRGTLDDAPNLNYLRDVTGLVEWMFDSGIVAVFDPQAFRWWSKTNWHQQLFEAGQSGLHSHVSSLQSDESNGTWLHTRGMRKFGRPDLSVRHVPAPSVKDAASLINRFIEFQALGGVIEDGKAIRVSGLPEGMTCRLGGDVDDPDFNNTHAEIVWPRG